MPNPANSFFLPAVWATPWSRSRLYKDLGLAVLVALAYYVGSLIGFQLRFPSSGIGYIWPPNGILLAALLIAAPHSWPAVLAASLAAHAVAHVQDNLSWSRWIWLFSANAGQALLGAILVRRFCQQPLRLETLRGVAVFVGAAALAAPAVASAIAALPYVTLGWAGGYWSAWGMRTLTNVVTTLTVVPPLLAIFGKDRQALRALTPMRATEFILLLLGLFAVEMFVLQRTATEGLPPALYACMPFLAWAAARFGIPGLSICLLSVAYLSIGMTEAQLVSDESRAVRTILGIQMFVAFGASPLMFLSVVLGESHHARRAEEALLHSEAKNTAILRAMPDLMFVQSSGQGYRYVDFYASNPGELLAPPEQFLGKRMRDVLPYDLAWSFENVIEKAVATGATQVLDYSLTMDGESRHFEARVVPCDDDRVLSIVRETTESKRAEAALHVAEQKLARMSRASELGELAASIAHEVQQPLSAIALNATACSRWLNQGPPDIEAMRAALAAIVEDSQRASQVIRRTRELFRGGARENAPVDLNAAIREVLTLTRNRAERGGDFIRLDLKTGPLIVMGDRVQLQQVLLNLVVNGLDAMRELPRERRRLLLRSWTSDGFVHVAVRDNGRGFDPEDIARIFDPFYTTKSDGLGMGLAISRSIVREHGGKLEATLNRGEGATFELTIPAAAPTG